MNDNTMKRWKDTIERLADHVHRAHAEMLRAAINSAERAMTDPSEEGASQAFSNMALAKVRYSTKLKSFAAQLGEVVHAQKSASPS